MSPIDKVVFMLKLHSLNSLLSRSYLCNRSISVINIFGYIDVI